MASREGKVALVLAGGGMPVSLPYRGNYGMSDGVYHMLTRGVATLTDPLNGEGGSGGSSTLAAVAGYPSVTVPAVQFFGLPVGLSFVGRPWSEAKLLALAADFEAATKARVDATPARAPAGPNGRRD